MRPSPIAFVGSAGQAPNSFAGSFPASHGLTESPIGSVGLSDIVDIDAAASAVLETALNGTAVGITAFAAEPGHTVEYTLVANPSGLFSIGLGTGVVTKAAALDAETALSHDITVRATSSSGKIKDRIFSIAVSDADEFDVGPITDANGAANQVIESAANGTPVGITAQATDADVSDTVTYSLFDDAGGRFAIDSNTGIVTVADTGLLDFETATSHIITVRATSTDASTTDQNFTIDILNDVSDDGLVPAARFDGTNDSLSRVTPTGAVDNGNALGGLPIRFMGGDGVAQYIWSNSTGSYIRKNADNTIEVFMANAAGVEVFKIISTNGFTVASGQLLIELTKDKLYVNNVDETGTRTTGAGGTIDWTSEWYWGRDSAGGNRMNAEAARLYLTNEDVDIAVNRNLFASSFAPITLADIKTDGSGPTGTAALDLLAGAYNAFGINSGTAGNHTTAGTLTVGTGPAGAALTAPGVIALAASHWRFYEDGTESGAVARAAEDVAPSVDLSGGDAIVLLRIQLREIGGLGMADHRFDVATRLNGGAWTSVDTAAWTTFPGTLLTNNGDTTGQLTVPPAGAFVVGDQIDSGGFFIANNPLTANNFTEHIVGFNAVALELANTDTVEVRFIPRVSVSNSSDDIYVNNAASAGAYPSFTVSK